MRPEQLERFASLTDPRVHPGGTRVAFVVTRMEFEDDHYAGRIWLWDGAAARPFTAGPYDSAPRWSPDGRTLAFVRKERDDDAQPQLMVMAADGGEAERLTEFSLGVAEVEWSPDGSRLAVVGKVWTEEWDGLDADERSRKPRRITSVPYRGDNKGWVHDRRSHVFLVDPEGASVVPITEGDFNETGISWRPDSGAIAFLSDRHDTRGIDPANQAWEVDVAGGEPRALTPLGQWGGVFYDPGGVVHVIGSPGVWDPWPGVVPLQRLDPDGSMTNLTESLDRSVVSVSAPVRPFGPQWTDDGRMFTAVEDAGRMHIYEVSDAPRPVLTGDRYIMGFSPNRAGTAAAFVATSPTDPGELWWWDGTDERPLTAINEQFRRDSNLVAPTRFSVNHEAVEIEGWVYLPPGTETVPALLNIHGGPASQYGYSFFDEFQVYAGAGYGVIACNPRGSSGYGRDHVRAVVGEWQTDDPPDLRDVLAAVDVALEEFPRLDASRLGVMGGSYGGLMTVRVLAASDRFKSAVAERGLYSWLSFAGSSDIGAWFDRMYVGEQLPDGWDALRSASSLSYAAAVTTPTLVLHAENDYRTPIEQGEQLFMLLLRRGVVTELLRFPEESHEMSRSGKPRHRRERFEAILDWHEKHLAKDGADLAT